MRIPNVVFDDDFGVRAVLDWEMASIGPAELDIGWYLVIHAMTTEAVGDLPGFLPRDEVLRTYEAQLGRELHDLAWYEAWAAFRSAAIMVRLTTLLHELGLVADLSMQEHNPPADRLRALQPSLLPSAYAFAFDRCASRSGCPPTTSPRRASSSPAKP